jgi:hypothetical protein
VPKDETIDPDSVQSAVDHIMGFLDNPNTNKENFEKILRRVIRDILEIDAGVINKIFNKKGEMVEIVAKDGSCFTKNPDAFGMITNRLDIVPYDEVAIETEQFAGSSRIGELYMPLSTIMMPEMAREKAAYFQY